MNLLQKLGNAKRAILFVWLLFLIYFGIWIVYVGHANSFSRMQLYHSGAANFIFANITHLGDGIFIMVLAVSLAFFQKWFLSMGVVSGYLVSGLFAQLGKRLLNQPRPKAFFEALGQQVYEVPGVKTHLYGSFPSGHTASVFALAIFLLLALPVRWGGVLLVLLACVVGYSRIYLSQHFPVDVFAGALIGTFSGCLVYWILQKKLPEKLKN